MVNQIGLGIGQTFLNPLHYRHEAGSEVLFAPSHPGCATPSSVVDDFWASSQRVAAPQATL